MTVRLSIRTAVWRSQVAQFASSVDGLIPVIKGNGYGFGRPWLAEFATELSDLVAVGNVHELDAVPQGLDAVVLTPALAPPPTTDPILTIGNEAHVEALHGWAGRVVVKRSSSMQRFGRGRELVDTARAAGLDVVAIAIHPPLAGTMADHRDEIIAALTHLDPTVPIWVSHLDPATYGQLPDTHRFRLRVGTMLWHGDKSALHLEADVLDVRRVSAGERAGYRHGTIDDDGHLVMIGAGTANGVAPLPGGLSPFHFRRRRVALHEPPHMHVTMGVVPDQADSIESGQPNVPPPLPQTGDWVDVQRPLHTTLVDEYRWL